MTRWAVGLTTVPKRRDDLLARTLFSLAASGFERPRLFVDGSPEGYGTLGLPITFRTPPVLPYANFVLGLAELFFRDPEADAYAMFQDDLITSKNLRPYLERSLDLFSKTYYNLYSFPSNESLSKGRAGWHESNQLGRGALALVFSNRGVIDLLSNQHVVERPKDKLRGWRSTDGGVVTALKKVGYKEMVHSPSLVQHTGHVSSFDKGKLSDGRHASWVEYRWPESTFSRTFRGEDFDCLLLLEK